jgi:hypothetical protein
MMIEVELLQFASREMKSSFLSRVIDCAIISHRLGGIKLDENGKMRAVDAVSGGGKY